MKIHCFFFAEKVKKTRFFSFFFKKKSRPVAPWDFHFFENFAKKKKNQKKVPRLFDEKKN